MLKPAKDGFAIESCLKKRRLIDIEFAFESDCDVFAVSVGDPDMEVRFIPLILEGV